MSSTLTTVEISAAVSAVTGAVAGDLWRSAGARLQALRQRLAPDHRPLHDASWSLTGTSMSPTEHVQVRVACAPNRSLDKNEIDPDMVVPFLRASFPSLCDGVPAYSSSLTGVRFEAAGGADHGFVWAWKSGRLDLSWLCPIATEPLTLVAVDLLAPVAAMIEAVTTSRYQQLYGRTFRKHRRRYDWFISVSTSVNHSELGSTPWTAIAFPGRTPPRAGAQQQPFSPAVGFAASQLRDWSPRDPDQVLHVFLEDFLKVNGYHDVVGAVEDTIAAFRDPSRSG